MYTKAYSFGGNEASLRVKQTFELSEFELSRFYCINYHVMIFASISENVIQEGVSLPNLHWPGGVAIP